MVVIFKLTNLYSPQQFLRSDTERIFRVFEKEARRIITESTQKVLGDPSLLGWDISANYAKVKSNRKGFRRIPGKPSSQPLIFDADKIYDAILVRRNGETVEVMIDPAKGMDGGFDVAEYWESGEGSNSGFAGTKYLEKGLQLCEKDLAYALGEIIVREWGL